MPSHDPEARRAYQRAWAKAKYHKNIEESRAKNRAKSPQRAEQKRGYHRAWHKKTYPKSRDTIIARSHEAYHRDLEVSREKARIQYQRHRAKKLAYMQEWQAAHPEQVAAYKKGWKQRNPERVNAQARKDGLNRRVRKAAVANTLSHAQWLEIQETQDHRCWYCGKRAKGKLTQDHILSLSKGGPHTLHNVIAACRSCNSKKNNRAPLTPVQPLLLTLAPAKKKKAS
jgi:5-methylcytosine-specific restriction endonuclease McrA